MPAVPARFVVRGELGRGGQGVVVAAFDTLLQQDVALKILSPRFAGNAEVIERLRREAALARRVAHPGLCRVYDLIVADSATFLVMELVRGKSLADRMLAGPLDVAAAVRFVAAAARGVAAAHAAGIVHRDLKPSNIVIDDDGRVVVVDFGVATAADLPKLTQTDIVVGTRAYIAPELWLGAPATPLADVYALGVLLYRALTDQAPYDVDGAADAPVPPSQRRAGIAPALDTVVLKAMAPQPRDRVQSARALADALDAVLASGPAPSPALVSASVPAAPGTPSSPEPLPDPLPNTQPDGLSSARDDDDLDDPTLPEPRPLSRAARAAGAVFVAVLVAWAVAVAVDDVAVAVIDAGANAVDAGVIDAGAVIDVDAGVIDAGAIAVDRVVDDVAGARRAAVRALLDAQRDRGFVAGDVPAFDRALARARAAKTRAAAQDARASGERAIQSVAVDARFLDTKLTRANARFATLSGESKRTAQRHLEAAAGHIVARRYDDANAALNRALGH